MANIPLFKWTGIGAKIWNSAQEIMDLLSVRIGASNLEIKETSGKFDFSNKELSGVASPTTPSSAVNLEYFKSNASGVAYGQTRLADDFISGATTGCLGWNTNYNGTNAGTFIDNTQIDYAHPGIVRVSTGTLISGRASLNLGPTGGQIVFNANSTWTQEWYVKLSDLYGIPNKYTLMIGYGNNVTAASTNGVYFWYDGASSTRWRLRTTKAGTTTTVTSSVDVVAATWLKLQIVVTGLSASFYVNGTLLGTIATNIPQLASEAVSPMIYIQKSDGLIARQVYVDKFFLTGTY